MNPTETNVLATEASLHLLCSIQSRFNKKAIGLIEKNIPEDDRPKLSKAMEVVSSMYPERDPETIKQFVRDMPESRKFYREIAEVVANSITDIWGIEVVRAMLPAKCLTDETQQDLRDSCPTLAIACVPPHLAPPA